MKNLLKISGLLLVLIMIFLMHSCKKDKVRIEKVTTTDVTNITYSTASSGGNIRDDGGHTITSRGVCWSTSSGPTITDSITVDSSGTGPFTSSIVGLRASNTYYLRAYATSTEGTVYGNEVSFSTMQLGANLIQDIDGNVYNTVTIGTQVWMKENLKTTRYNNGTAIPNVTDPTAWKNLYRSGAYCDYDNDPANSSIYGRLYNYYVCESVSGKVCPAGWHVPGDGDWGTLAIYLGGTNIAGGKLKETGTDHWSGPNTGATNETGFTALPGGSRRQSDGIFSDKGGLLCLWELQFSQSVYFSQRLFSNSSQLFREQVATQVTVLSNGYSIRCIKDAEIPVLTTADVTNITSASATCGGSILSGGTIGAKGVCWNTSGSPTLTDNKTTDGTGGATFVSNIMGLNGSTTYYVRSYASTGAGTGYGPGVSFTTKNAEVPVLITTEITTITPKTATSGGYVTSTGGSPVASRGVCWSTSANPTTSDYSTSDATGSGSFISNLTGLTPNTIYYLKAYATNSVGTGYGELRQFRTPQDFTGQTGTLTDVEGNIYKTIGIGGQIWIAENLKTTRFNDGTAIPNVTNNDAWYGLHTAAYCDYNNDLANSVIYGKLYNWYVVDNNEATKVTSNGGKNVCPSGWHVPADEEWTVLTTFLGGASVAGGKLKDTVSIYWNIWNWKATNQSGFTGLPGGYRHYYTYYHDIGYYGYWWSTTSVIQSSTHAWNRSIRYYDTSVGANYSDNDLGHGMSVRCLKDN